MKRSVFSVLVDPGTGRLNGRAELKKRGPRYEIGTSDRYKGCKAAVASAARVAASRRRFDSGLLAFSMTFYCSSERHLENMPKWFELGNLDVDSPINAYSTGCRPGDSSTMTPGSSKGTCASVWIVSVPGSVWPCMKSICLPMQVDARPCQRYEYGTCQTPTPKQNRFLFLGTLLSNAPALASTISSALFAPVLDRMCEAERERGKLETKLEVMSRVQAGRGRQRCRAGRPRLPRRRRDPKPASSSRRSSAWRRWPRGSTLSDLRSSRS